MYFSNPGGWRRLHNEEFRNLCASPNIIKENEMRMQHAWESCEIHTKFYIGKPEGKRTLGRPRLRWEYNK